MGDIQQNNNSHIQADKAEYDGSEYLYDFSYHTDAFLKWEYKNT